MLIAGVMWWVHTRRFESTDVFIGARIVSISSQVNGAVVDVPGTDDELVDTGVVLAPIGPRDYQAQFDQARAQLEQIMANIANLDAQIDTQQSCVEQGANRYREAQGAPNFATQENDRCRDLLAKGAGTRQRA